jgi:hypothetical protein
MMRFRSSFFLVPALAAGLVAGVAGCGDGKPSQPVGTVSGKVQFSGKPVETGVVNFESLKTGAAAQATISDGEFEVPVPVPLGQYKVTVSPPPEAPPVPGKKVPPPRAADIPVRYQTQKTSNLSAEVKEGSNEFTFELK